MRTQYGVATDWPITYGDLESHYETVEKMWGVAGDPSYDWGSPRRTPYPLPPIPSTYLDQMVEGTRQARAAVAAVLPCPQLDHLRRATRVLRQ